MTLPLIALAVALVLVLLVAATAVLVKLVLWLSLSRTLLVVAAATLYWFVTSRRRCLARGFYSCSQVPKEMTETIEMETEPVDEHAAACEPAAYGPQMKMSKKIQLDDAVDSSVAVEEAPVLLNADVEVQVADQVAPDVTAEDTEDADAGVKVNPVRRRSMQLPAPLLVKTLGDASSPSLSATESEDDEEELTLTTRSYASRSTAASPMRAAAAMSPAPPTSGRKIRPRSSSSSSGFSVANRKRLLGSPVRQPHFHPQPQPHPHSSTSSSSAATARPSHPTGMMMTPVRNRRAATVTSNPSTGSSKSQSSTHSSSSGGLIKRNAFVRRSAASERELMQEKMAADGYWIGDFRLERQLVARRSFLSKDGGNGSGNNSARSSPRAV